MHRSWWISVIVWLASSQAFAQAATVELTESQLDLNGRAIEFIGTGEYSQAVKLFESSLSLGKTNVTYLNLGRTLTKLGRCSAAQAAYDAAETAPAVPEPSREQVAATLERYRAQLPTCGTKVIIECDPPNLQVRVDGAEPTECPDSPVRLDSGTHEITAIGIDGATRSQTIEASPSETLRLVLVGPKEAAPAVLEPAPDPEPARRPLRRADMGKLRLAGWAVGLTGVAMLATATVIDLFVVSPRVNRFRDDPRAHESERDSIQSSQRVNRVLFPLGAVLGAAGAGMLLWPAPMIETGVVGVSWRFAF